MRQEAAIPHSQTTLAPLDSDGMAAAAVMEMDALVEAFLLRLPSDDPASLVRAALVCRLWRRILADRGFRRRFCELHRRPPMLGFLAFSRNELRFCFTPTSSFRPRNADLPLGLCVIDSRHGRVLLASEMLHTNLAVWDPISGDRLDLPKLLAPQRHHLDTVQVQYFWNAAVLCASNPNHACDSIQCHFGKFLVVLMITSPHGVYVFVYSSQAGTWSEITSVAQEDPLDPKLLITLELGALAGNALYFKFDARLSSGILKYDLGMQEIGWINLPSNFRSNEILLTTTEYGGLGIARMESSRVHLWSWEAGPGGHLGWTPSRVIELNTVLPANTQSTRVAAFMHGLGTFLVSTNSGAFTVDIDTNQARKVSEDICGLYVPYMCFCTPAPCCGPYEHRGGTWCNCT